MLLFLFPFQHCTLRFECNRTIPEVDYVFFAYDTLYNHIDDVKDKLRSGVGLGAPHCAPFILKAIEAMETTLRKYYERTSFPTVYGDAMILNPRTKLSIFTEESWQDTDADEYSNGCRKCFIDRCTERVNPQTDHVAVVIPIKHGRPDVDLEYEQYKQLLLQRAMKRRRNNYDPYIETPNDPKIHSMVEGACEQLYRFGKHGKKCVGCACFGMRGRATVQYFWSNRDLAKESSLSEDNFQCNDISSCFSKKWSANPEHGMLGYIG